MLQLLWMVTDKAVYQLPLILTALLHLDLINAAYLTVCLYQVIMMSHFLNDIVNDIELTRKLIITS